jgi:AAA family ATP:ADP antiporter
MPTASPSSSTAFLILRRVVNVQASELVALIASFSMFFALLSAYYIIRPVRDEMGVAVGKDDIHRLFTIVFCVMLAAVPLFGFIASRFPRRWVLPAVYLFFVLNLVMFWAILKAQPASPWAAGSFFVWASVFNLFVVSLFWSLMSELWTNENAERLYGFISAGGTAGALAGPLITQVLVRTMAPADLLLVSAALLTVAMFAGMIFRHSRPRRADAERSAVGGGIFDGAIKVIREPFFGRIALFIFLANVVGTFFYMEQSRLVGVTIAESADRVAFFAGRDLAVSIATLAIQILGTAFIMQRLGLTAALVALPLTALLGALVLSLGTTLWIVAAVMVAERVISFALAGPAIKVMYTLAHPDEKYKVQNFIDTVVYRGGDAVSGWMFSIVSGGAGFAAAATSVLAVPMAALWFWNARRLGKDYAARAAANP